MGLLDILNGLQNGPRGERVPAPSGSGGMSPVAMALLGLVAYKAIKHFSAGSSNAESASAPNEAPAGGRPGGLLQGPLGNLLAGGAAGSVLSCGLNDLVKQFQQKGLGDVVQSWVQPGANKTITPDVLSKVLTEEQIRTLTGHSGMSRDELMTTLSQQLPQLMDKLTPDGRLPTENEASRMI